MNRPRLLDLFCGAGGAAMGYHWAGFDVVGVDIKPQPHYPFEFHQGDAMEILSLVHPLGNWPVGKFDTIHASPPCQRYSVATVFHPGRQAEHPDLVDPCRDLLQATGLPWVIENVMGAPLRNPIMLCGTMFEGLRVYRHRNFEASPSIYWPPMHYQHPERPAEVGRKVPDHGWMTVAGHFSDVKAASRAMGIDWMSRDELRQAIPPAYTAWIGEQLMRVLRPDVDGRYDGSSTVRIPDIAASPGPETGSILSTDGLVGNGSFGRSHPSGSVAIDAYSLGLSRGRDDVA